MSGAESEAVEKTNTGKSATDGKDPTVSGGRAEAEGLGGTTAEPQDGISGCVRLWDSWVQGSTMSDTCFVAEHVTTATEALE